MTDTTNTTDALDQIAQALRKAGFAVRDDFDNDSGSISFHLKGREYLLSSEAIEDVTDEEDEGEPIPMEQGMKSKVQQVNILARTK